MIGTEAINDFLSYVGGRHSVSVTIEFEGSVDRNARINISTGHDSDTVFIDGKQFDGADFNSNEHIFEFSSDHELNIDGRITITSNDNPW